MVFAMLFLQINSVIFVAMSLEENMIFELHTKKRTWKIAVRITDMWHVNKHNGRQVIEMLFMDQTVCLLMFNAVFEYIHFAPFFH